MKCIWCERKKAIQVCQKIFLPIYIGIWGQHMPITNNIKWKRIYNILNRYLCKWIMQCSKIFRIEKNLALHPDIYRDTGNLRLIETFRHYSWMLLCSERMFESWMQDGTCTTNIWEILLLHADIYRDCRTAISVIFGKQKLAWICCTVPMRVMYMQMCYGTSVIWEILLLYPDIYREVCNNEALSIFSGLFLSDKQSIIELKASRIVILVFFHLGTSIWIPIFIGWSKINETTLWKCSVIIGEPILNVFN